MAKTIRLEFEYESQPSLVWRALTDPELMAKWLMPNDFQPQIGHKFQLRTDPGPGFDGIVNCEVLELVEHEKLSFTWKGGPIDTILTWELSPTPNGTKLTVIQSGFEGFAANLVKTMLKMGSKKIYGTNLRSVIQHLADQSEIQTDGSCGPIWKGVAAAAEPILRKEKE